ncbi:neuropeptide S [Hyla sarda]|uniref:neuropeptide S n=1 Tax=Hyla sarda TaxID=327740 RepID=UPI0024C3E8EC|nr:neuropeptide S [Hyla sarda]
MTASISMTQEQSIKHPPDKWKTQETPMHVVTMEGLHLNSVSKLHFVFIFWIYTMHLWYQPGMSVTSSGKSDYCLILLNSCLVEADRSEELAFLQPFLEKSFMKRSFRNGVGSGFKKNSFRRAKS